METTLPLRQIDHDVFVAPQLDAAAMAEVARLRSEERRVGKEC